MSKQDNKETGCTAIKLYDKSEAYICPKNLPHDATQTIIIMELVEVSYHELLSIATKNALSYSQYDTQGRPLLFLTWLDNYLFYHGTINTTQEYSGEKYPDYLLNFFYYTRFSPYKETIADTIFDEKVKACVEKTSRPILVQIIEYIKSIEPPAPV